MWVKHNVEMIDDGEVCGYLTPPSFDFCQKILQILREDIIELCEQLKPLSPNTFPPN